MWEHDGCLEARHAAEEEAIWGLVDVGSELDDLMKTADYGDSHIHRQLGKGKKHGEKIDRNMWSSAYLQAGDVLMVSSGYLMLHAAMKSSMQPCTAVMLQYQRAIE